MGAVELDNATPVGADVGSARRAVDAGRVVIVATLLAVTVELLRVDGGVAGTELASSWQLLDLGILSDDPLGGIWYLHTQPPLHNLVVGLVAWSPLPVAGTIFALDIACLLVLGLLVHDLLLRWRVPAAVATIAACLAIANPALLSTIRIVSYEVPLATMLLALVWVLDRYLAAPTRPLLLAFVGLAAAMVLTRSLFHPAWFVVVVAVVLWARRVSRRTVATCLVVPLLVFGGVAAKNAALVGTASLSSWTGFNLHRGVLGPIDAATVDEAIAAGAVSDLAAAAPWQGLDAYRPWLDGCRSTSDHPALGDPVKHVGPFDVPNFNHECYVGLYRQSSGDALTMIGREPGEYAAGRVLALAMSHVYTPLGHDSAGTSILGEPLPSTSWMDRLYSLIMVRTRIDVDMSGWNVPLYGDTFRLELAWPLVLATLLVAVRTSFAAGRCWRSARRRRPPGGREVVWLVAGATILFVIVGGDLIELGENGRFRSMLDPLVLTLVTSEVVAVVTELRARRTAPADV